MTNPYLKRVAERNKGDSGRDSEKRVAKKMGGKLQANSGATPFSKGDFKLRKKIKFLVEAKSTTTQVLKLESDWLIKINREALAIGCSPALTISFTDDSGKLRNGACDWVCVPRAVFDELTENQDDE